MASLLPTWISSSKINWRFQLKKHRTNHSSHYSQIQQTISYKSLVFKELPNFKFTICSVNWCSTKPSKKTKAFPLITSQPDFSLSLSSKKTEWHQAAGSRSSSRKPRLQFWDIQSHPAIPYSPGLESGVRLFKKSLKSIPKELPATSDFSPRLKGFIRPTLLPLPCLKRNLQNERITQAFHQRKSP